MSAAYPLMLNVVDRLSVIIGGGGVALRKANGLIDAGAKRIRMVSPSFHDDIPVIVDKIFARFQPDHLEGAGLVFAVTDSAEINDAVVCEARRRGILVNRADSDDDEPGDFTTPALSRHGPVVVTVSTAGAPALAAMIRDSLARHIDPQWCRMAEAMQVLRPKILTADHLRPDERRDVFRSLATSLALTTLATGGVDLLWESLILKFPRLASSETPVRATQQ